MSGDPLVDARIATIKRSKAARDEKRAKEAARLAERQVKDEKEIHSAYSVNEAAAKEAQSKVNDYYQAIFEQQQAQELEVRNKKDIAELEQLRAEFFEPTTTPIRRGSILSYACDIHRRLNRDERGYGTPISAEALYELWKRRRQEDARKELLTRLQKAVGE